MTRYQPEGWEPISDHYAKPDTHSPAWVTCRTCGRAVAHHVSRLERFLLWLVGR